MVNILNKTNTYPKMALIEQSLLNKKIDDIPENVNKALNSAILNKELKKNAKIAIGIGSRGISNIKQIATTCISFFKNKGFNPFIIPAMGSHGGASSHGQKEIILNLGITEQDAPIKGSMEVDLLGNLPAGIPIFFSTEALKADYIIPINRIKPHTKFTAPIESGLCKMLTIGFGKAKGASIFHREAVKYGFGIIEEGAEFILSRIPLLFGLGIVEDGYGNTAIVEAFTAKDLIKKEKILLNKAYELMPRIPFDNIDVLIIDYIGKNISGIGMDSNVTGRHRDIVGDFINKPNVKRIYVRDLSPESRGNANGIGLADFTSTRCVKGIDLKKTYINSITALSPEKAAIPVHFETDKECIDACISTAGIDKPQKAKIVRIKNTSHLKKFQISEALRENVDKNKYLKCISNWEEINFIQGNLSEIDY